MEEKKAVEVFDLVVKHRMLPEKIEDLVPLSFIGQAAVNFHREKVALMDRLGMAEDQKRETLKDGQDAGRMLLTIEARIGELLPDSKEAMSTQRPGQPRRGPRQQRPDGITSRRATTARTIARHPEAVAQVIQEAEDNEDIPTKTAVLNKVKADQEKEKREAFEREHPKTEKPYLSEYLDECITRQVQTNSVLKEILDHKDQIEGARVREFVMLVKRTVEIINEKMEEKEKCKLLQ